MYHTHRPLKNQCRDFFSLGHLFHFLEMEQLSLYKFLHTFRSMPAASRACCHLEHSLMPLLNRVLAFSVFFHGKCMVPITSHSNLLILQDANTTPSKKLSLLLSIQSVPSFCPHDCFGIFPFSFAMGILTYPPIF